MLARGVQRTLDEQLLTSTKYKYRHWSLKLADITGQARRTPEALQTQEGSASRNFDNTCICLTSLSLRCSFDSNPFETCTVRVIFRTTTAVYVNSTRHSP